MTSHIRRKILLRILLRRVESVKENTSGAKNSKKERTPQELHTFLESHLVDISFKLKREFVTAPEQNFDKINERLKFDRWPSG